MESSKNNCIIRRYSPGDEDKIVKLLIDVFKPWPGFNIECSAVDHWKWKYIDNPANKDICLIVIAEINQEIVGVTHGMPFYIKIGEGKHVSNKGADVAVSSNYRGLGIYTKINDLKYNIWNETKQEFNYSLSENPFLLNKRNRRPESQFPFPQPLKSLIKINDVDKHFKRTVKGKTLWEKTLLKTGVHGLKTVSKLTNLSKRTPQLKDITFREIARFDDGINAFYEKVKPHYNFIVERTLNYMNWRYCDKRGGDYKVWIAEKGDEVVGYLVLSVNRIDANYPEGYVIDFLTLNGREDVAEYFAKFAVDYFAEAGVNVVHAQIIGGHPYERVLGKYGFLDSRAKYQVLCRGINLGDDLERFVKSPPTMLHYTHGEGDSI